MSGNKRFYSSIFDHDTVGRAACLSVPQLVRQFKRAYGSTPYRYLAQIRLRHAGELLRKTGIPGA